jgi:hypothetical protein
MSVVTFAGVTLKNWQTPKETLTREDKRSELVSELTHVSRSSEVIEFPKIFQCYTETTLEKNTVKGLINYDYLTLSIDGVNYTNCYVYQISEIWEVQEGSGIWTHSIEFRQADTHS